MTSVQYSWLATVRNREPLVVPRQRVRVVPGPCLVYGGVERGQCRLGQESFDGPLGQGGLEPEQSGLRGQGRIQPVLQVGRKLKPAL